MAAEYRRSNKQFINPYTFVPAPRRQPIDRKPLDNTPSSRLHTGVLRCRLYVRTPVGIPDAELAKEEGEHSAYPFFSYREGGKRILVIPGSSLRGPLRSVFETATDSCFSTLRENTGLSRRVGNREAYTPGILKWEKGTWHLYKADRYLLAVDPKMKVDPKVCSPSSIDKNYRRYPKVPPDSYICISWKRGGTEPRVGITQKGEKLRFGDRVEFSPYTREGGRHVKNGHPVWKGAARDVTKKAGEADKHSGRQTGLVYIGETFSKKKRGESVFVPTQEELGLKKDQLEKAYEGLLETLEIYRNPAINRGKNHSGYSDFEHARKENGIPVWYAIKDEKLSLASIGRTFFRTSLNDLVGERKPCVTREKLCQACALFGMAGEESLGSRIRVTDARAEGDYVLRKSVLKILGQPRYSYMPFYARFSSGTGTSTSAPASYDDKNAEIAGRKFYWHNKRAAKDPTLYSGEQKNKMNSTMELVMPGAEFCFDIYYDGVTGDQLEKLMWCVHFGENQKDGDLCHKIGHGKPLGLGSVKIVIEERAERVFQDGTYTWKEEALPERVPEPALKNRKALKRVMSFQGPDKDEKIPIMYPDVYDTNGNPFPEPRGKGEEKHVWYTKNKEDRGNDPVETLPNILAANQRLHAYEKLPDHETGARSGREYRGR